MTGRITVRKQPPRARIVSGSIALVLLIAAAGVTAQPIGPEKKLIMAGGSNFARVETFAKDVAEMEQRVPVDGVAFYPPSIERDGKRIRLGRPFRGDRLRIEDFEPFIADLRAAKPTRYKHNFLYTYLTTGDPEVAVPDWFDPEFDAVVHNWRVIADFCKRAGLVGVMFDDEVYYGKYLWTYERLQHESKTPRQYADQAFLRGAQIMRAINTVYPDIHFLSLHGPSHVRPPGDPAVRYALISAFFDGLLSESKGKARIIDGHEVAYGYRYPVTYATALRAMKEESRQHSRAAAKYDDHFRAAFSFFFGPYGSMPFTEDVSSNYYTPEEFEYALHHALKHTDEYVWLYAQKCYWWKMGSKPGILVPPAYHEALARVRLPHPDAPVLRNLDAHAAPKPGSAKPPRKLGWPVHGYDRQVGYEEEETFGDLWDQYRELTELSNLWRFRIDPLNQGVREEWFRGQVDERDWFWITSDLPWDNHGYRLYDGYGWYRQEFRSPMIPEGKRVYLAFGAVAHGAEVYINGELAGQHNMDGWAYTAGDPWQRRFLIEATGRLRSETKNMIAVRVVDYGTWGGGIWKPVKLIAEK